MQNFDNVFMKYGIVGSRKRADKHNIINFVNSLSLDDIVISGGCKGVDTWAVEAAKLKGLSALEYKPNLTGCKQKWEFTRAYHARNELIAQSCDILVAFVSFDRKGGTENTIKHAKKLGKRIIIL